MVAPIKYLRQLKLLVSMLVAEKIKNWVFKKVHVNNLVYNTCWEDPRSDRRLMGFDKESEIVMITSAGCNALAYLLDDPKAIHCIDMNPRQNSLLELKLALFKNSNHESLFQFFGKGKHPQYDRVYWDSLREDLKPHDQAFWDKHINYFSEKGVRKNFYHYGTAGTFVWLFSAYLKSRKKLRGEIMKLLNAQSLEEQRDIYFRIEDKILNRLMEFVVNRHFTMCLLGVPRSQQELFVHEYVRGAMGFIQECLRHVFTELPLADNYFYRVYVEGAYTQDCCPAYLEAVNFSTIRDRSNRIQTYSTTLSDFLIENPAKYSHFILLDHQDWLAENHREALEEEWRLILENSKPGTKVLLRSAAQTVNFFPDFVRDGVEFEQEKTRHEHLLDRVGTYASVHMAIVK